MYTNSRADLGVGQQHYENLVFSRLATCTKHFYGTIKKNSFVILATKRVIQPIQT